MKSGHLDIVFTAKFYSQIRGANHVLSASSEEVCDSFSPASL